MLQFVWQVPLIQCPSSQGRKSTILQSFCPPCAFALVPFHSHLSQDFANKVVTVVESYHSPTDLAFFAHQVPLISALAFSPVTGLEGEEKWSLVIDGEDCHHKRSTFSKRLRKTSEVEETRSTRSKRMGFLIHR